MSTVTVPSEARAESRQAAARLGRPRLRSAAAWGPWLPLALAVVWPIVMLRAIPPLSADRGIFVSVAERLRAGDRLYADVWDNKDPLFYFSMAAGRAISPYSDVVLEIGWLLGASTGIFWLTRSFRGDTRAGVLAGFVLTPLVLTGAVYHSGYTNLPGTALAFLALAAAMRRRYAMSGVLLGLLCFMKFVVLPVAGLLVVVVVGSRRSWRGFGAAALGFLTVGTLVFALLGTRGELAAYLHTFTQNVAYSEGPLIDSGSSPFVAHLNRVMSPGLIAASLAVALVVALDRAFAPSGPEPDREGIRLLRWLAGAALIGALAVLGAAGMWDHHSQILYLPGTLAGMIVVLRLGERTRVASGAAVLSVVLLGLALSGSNAVVYRTSAEWATRKLTGLTAEPPEAAALRTFAPTGSYARVGQNNDGGHAFGTRDRRLACPRFHQYPFDSTATFDGVLACLPTADAIVVSASAAPRPGQESWNAYVRRVEDLLLAEYICHPWADGRICVRR